MGKKGREKRRKGGRKEGRKEGREAESVKIQNSSE